MAVRAVVAAALAGALLGSLVGVPAARAGVLGLVTSATLYSMDAPATVPDPAALAYDSFDGTDGTAVTTGSALDVGGTWTKSTNGSFSLQANGLVCGGGNRSNLTVDVGRADVQLDVTVTLLSTAAGRSGGVVLRGGTSGYLRVLFHNTGTAGSVELSKVVGNTETVLGAANLSGTSIPTSGMLRVRAVGTTIQVWFGGAATPSTFTLSGADALTYASGSRVGVTMDGDTGTALDDFRAALP